MSAKPARHLHLVDAETGEIVPSRELAELQAKVEKLDGDLKAAERDLRVKRRRITELERDQARERLEHPRYQDAVRVAKYWWKRCRNGHHRVHYLAPNRIDAVLALMDIEELVVVPGRKRRQRQPHYELAHFVMAVDGAWFDPFKTTHRNGKEELHNDLAQICKDATRFDRFIAKSPTSLEVAREKVLRDTSSRVPTGRPTQAAMATGEGSYGRGGLVGSAGLRFVDGVQAGRVFRACGVEVGVAGESCSV